MSKVFYPKTAVSISLSDNALGIVKQVMKERKCNRSQAIEHLVNMAAIYVFKILPAQAKQTEEAEE